MARRRGRVARARRPSSPSRRRRRATQSSACTMRPYRRDAANRRPAARSMLDPDTFTSPESCDVTRLAAGAAVGGGRRGARTGRPRGRRRSCGRPAITAAADRGAGLLPVQQRRRRGRPRARAGRAARRHRRLRRAPRQRHAGDLRGRSPRAVRLDAPVPATTRAPGAADEVGVGRRARASR